MSEPQHDDDRRRPLRMEAMLAALLRYGAIVAGGWIALGLAWGPLAGGGSTFADRCLAFGVIMLIALPVMRVAMMTIIFAIEKDYRFVAISAAVLIIIAAGFLVGVFYGFA